MTGLSLQLASLRERVEEDSRVKQSLSTALQVPRIMTPMLINLWQVADKYKVHLVKEQGHLYQCHVKYYKVNV